MLFLSVLVVKDDITFIQSESSETSDSRDWLFVSVALSLSALRPKTGPLSKIKLSTWSVFSSVSQLAEIISYLNHDLLLK